MRFLTFLLICFVGENLCAEELSLENVVEPQANSNDEPIAADFSMERAVAFLDQSSLDWTKRIKCFTCHTNYLYLQARPMVSFDVNAHREIRAALEEMVNVRWETGKPRWDTEVVMTAAVLAMNDSLTTGKLDTTTRKALDRMWTVQRDDGGFNWLKCNWPPMEIDDDYGIAVAAIATGSAPENYAQTDAAKTGLQKLRDYLKKNPPPTLHHLGMLIWADSYETEMLTPTQHAEAVEQLIAKQLPDGGWAAASLADWKRADESPQDLETSDAYGTAFVVYVLRRSDVAADDPIIAKGIEWLKKNQRESGRWYSRSLYRDSKHYLSHAASAMAVMAIQSCEAHNVQR